MVTLPREIKGVLRLFEEVFSERVWDWVQVLVVGAILTPGRRTVAAILQVMGQSEERQFQNYHRVLNRASWSSREVGRRLDGRPPQQADLAERLIAELGFVHLVNGMKEAGYA